MSPLDRFYPLNLVRRSQQPVYSILPDEGDEPQFIDVEKRSLSSQKSSGARSALGFTASSSRSSSDSQQEAARNSSRRRRRPNGPGLYKLPHMIVRYMCFAIILTIVVFILSLVYMSWASSMTLQQGRGKSRPQPPPQWESFPLLERYYGGLRILVVRGENIPEYPRQDEQEVGTANLTDTPAGSSHQNVELPPSEPFNPYPDYASEAYLSEYGNVQECFLDAKSTIPVPRVHAYTGVPSGMPDPIFGAYDLLGLRDDVCFERFGKLGPYGFGYSNKYGGTGTGLDGEREGADGVWRDGGEVDFREIRWAEAQRRCATANSHRFGPKKGVKEDSFLGMDAAEGKFLGEVVASGDGTPTLTKRSNVTHAQPSPSGGTTEGEGKKKLPRTAFVIRTWSDYKYRDDHILFLRTVISELSLLSGGEYTVHFLVHVKDDNLPIWADEKVYQQTLRDALPEEFWGLGMLWTERQMSLIYGGLHESFYQDLPVHGAYRGLFMAMQHFAYKHPEYDYFWHWEMDIRYTGHFYHFLDRADRWAKEQPRKGLWERSSRFYIPAVHGSWEDFKRMVHVQSEVETRGQNSWKSLADSDPRYPSSSIGGNNRPVWGPLRPEDDEPLDPNDDPKPPASYDKDKYEWGVGEDADLITLNPLFNPEGSSWSLSDDVTGYNTTRGLPPRRAAILSSTRLSRRLLLTMHSETFRKRRSMFTEMWPASVALHHGLKAVFVPHPVHIDRRWPLSYLASVFDYGTSLGGGRRSVFGGMEHSFRGASWYYNAEFAARLWKRWMGARVDGAGGEDEEIYGEGRMCLRGMLLHPIK
ncbi:hypothetical protein FGG08_006711 [Glutinoglossum americanum]|uniref:Uncharacterized protein n=1 Tax=Glutinoglossum americanum TaxID=1670608 RepID=A0A9P8L0P3_9PEZI|nr:hypothetical protein FGG08_006711 [Glutinoglossum americanum]